MSVRSHHLVTCTPVFQWHDKDRPELPTTNLPRNLVVYLKWVGLVEHPPEAKHAKEHCRCEGERTLWCNDNGLNKKRNRNLTEKTIKICRNDSCR